MKDTIREIWSVLSHNKLRTILTGVSVAWGIFMLICLLGTGNGLVNATVGNVEGNISNVMSIYGGVTNLPYSGYEAGRLIVPTAKDIEVLKSGEFAPYIDEIIYATDYHREAAKYANESCKEVYLRGVGSNFMQVEKLKLAYGRFLTDFDERQGRKVVVLDMVTARQLADGKDPGFLLGKTINCGSSAFSVVGITHADESDNFKYAYAPYSVIRRAYPSDINFNPLMFTFKGLRTEKQNLEFEKRLTSKMNAVHSADPEDRVFWVWNKYRSNINMHRSVAIIKTAVWLIGLLTLIGGIVSVANIMLISVKERTREFGIRKAIGARPASILRLVITESICITTVFGYCGMLLGMLGNHLIDKNMGTGMELPWGTMKVLDNVSVGLDVAIEVTVVMIIAGTIAGLIPAYRAAHVKPIEALTAA